MKTFSIGNSDSGINRRNFVQLTAAGALLAGSASWSRSEETRRGEMIFRNFGSTGEKVSAIGLGGFHIGTLPSEAECTKMIRTAIDRGITFMDNCWDYHNGKSEEWMGQALRDGYRNRVFLMTKIDGQTRTAAARQIEQSLKRLQTDRIDLMQMHEMIRPEDPGRVFAENGAIHALLDARKQGKIRYIGFTGHKDPAIHLSVIETGRRNGVRFDAVQMPLNVMDAHFKSFEKEVVPVLVRDGTAVLGMKPLGSGDILKTGKVKAVECLHYALSLPTSVVITGIDNQKVLDQAFEAARTFAKMEKSQIEELLARTAEHAKEGKFERFKTSKTFDGTEHNPQWLGLNG